MESVERRKRMLINSAYFILILGIFYLFMKYAFWLFFPFLIAFFIAALIQKPLNAISNKTPLPKGLVSAVFVLLIVLVFGALVSLLGIKIVTEIKGFISFIMSRAESIPDIVTSARDKLIVLAQKLPDRIETSLITNIKEISNILLNTTVENEDTIVKAEENVISGGVFSGLDFSWLSTPLSGVLTTAKQIPSILVACLIGIVACCFMCSDYDRLVNFVKRQFSPQKRQNLSMAKSLLFSSLGKMMKSYLIIICITFVEVFVGLNVLRIIGVYDSGYIITIAIVVALIDIVPVLGTGTVLIPWAIISLIMGKTGLGIGIIVIYAVISVIRQIVEPKLVAANLGLPPVVTIFGMYVGLQLFGFIGLFIMPMALTMIKLLNDRGIINIWKTGAPPAAPQQLVEQDTAAAEDTVSTESAPAKSKNNEKI